MQDPKQLLRHVLIMMTGTAFAQAIPLLASPLLTRLYSPADFGALSAVVATAGLLSILGTLRYELAIVLPSDEKSAAQLAAIALLTSLATVASMAVVLATIPAIAATLFPNGSHYGWAIPLLTGLLGASQILSFVANRERRYRTIATSSVLQQLGAAGVGIGFGWAAIPINGLIVGRTVGYLIACWYYLADLGAVLKRWLRLVDQRKIVTTAIAYRQFPTFNVPYSLIGNFSREFLIFAFTAMHQLDAAGHYGLARSVLTAPIGFLSSSISQIFYKEAAVSIGSPQFKRLTLNSLQYLGAGLAPFFVLGWFWAPDVFQVVFGDRWREAGHYAALLMPIGCLSLFTSWPERVFEVRGKQHLSLIIQLVFDASTVAVVLIVLLAGSPALTAIKCYVAIGCLYHLTYLAAVFKLSGLRSSAFWKFVVLGLVCVAAVSLLEFLAALGATTILMQFAASAAAATVSSSALLLVVHRSTQSEAGFKE